MKLESSTPIEKRKELFDRMNSPKTPEDFSSSVTFTRAEMDEMAGIDRNKIDDYINYSKRIAKNCHNKMNEMWKNA